MLVMRRTAAVSTVGRLAALSVGGVEALHK